MTCDTVTGVRRAYFITVLLLLTACPSRAPSPPDARVATPVVAPDSGPANHVCYGPGGSAVEVDRGTNCASLGGSDTPPTEVRNAPAVRRDGGTLQPQLP